MRFDIETVIDNQETLFRAVYNDGNQLINGLWTNSELEAKSELLDWIKKESEISDEENEYAISLFEYLNDL